MAWISVGTLDELEKHKAITVRGKDRRIVIFWNDGEPQAVDNRCPHMGFPLDRGSVGDGILTCHWHHARFALKGGCAFDLFADDVPTFALRDRDGILEVSDAPDVELSEAYFRARLRRGLEQNLSLLQAKGIVGLLKSRTPTLEILRELVEFGCQNHESWADGMTLIALIARLDPVLSEKTRIYGLAWAARQIAANCADRPRRRERGDLSDADEPLERIQGWFCQFVIMRHRDGAERALLTANRGCRNNRDRQRILAGAILQRIYLDSGHLYDFANKALELGELLEAEKNDLYAKILPLLVPEAIGGQEEEDKGSWRNPFDLITVIRSAEEQLKEVVPGDGTLPAGMRELLLSDDPERILDTMITALRSGTSPESLALEIAIAAAWRLAHFSPSNELGDWFDPAHTFIYTNAVVQSIKRSPVAELLPALLHGAMAIFQDRFLNVPPGAYPDAPLTETEQNTSSLEQLLEWMDRVPSPRDVVLLVVQWVRTGGSIGALTDCLAWATIREDLDFHKLQVIEAAYQLCQDARELEDRALLMAGAARYLAAHCPTVRSRQQSTRNALRLY